MTCTATRLDGTACSLTALPGRSYCFAHDPERAEQRAAARKRGGENKATARRFLAALPNEYRAVLDRLMALMDDVTTGKVTPREAEAIGSLSSHVLAWAKFATELGQQQHLEQRLAELEAMVKAYAPHGRLRA